MRQHNQHQSIITSAAVLDSGTVDEYNTGLTGVPTNQHHQYQTTINREPTTTTSSTATRRAAATVPSHPVDTKKKDVSTVLSHSEKENKRRCTVYTLETNYINRPVPSSQLFVHVFVSFPSRLQQKKTPNMPKQSRPVSNIKKP